jgi:TM2 domain-containing membrane protein YozV
MVYIIPIIISFWIAFAIYNDARQRYQEDSYTPVLWAIGVFALLIIFLPVYLASRPAKLDKKKKSFPISLSCLLAWLLPGAGHLYLGKKGRAIVFFLCIFFLFFAGIVIQGNIFAFEQGKFLRNLATIADMGVGPIYFLAKYEGLERSNIWSYTYDYGTVFIIISGLLNILLVFDVYDIAAGRKN